MRRRGQVVSEYALTFFLIVAVITTMSMFIKRVLQARIYDARDAMSRTVAPYYSGRMPREYEPYYVQSESQITRSSNEADFLLGGGISGIAGKGLVDATLIHANGIQAPPVNGD